MKKSDSKYEQLIGNRKGQGNGERSLAEMWHMDN